MKVILLQDVRNVGRKDAIVEVSDGYATNFLIKNMLAVPASEHQLKQLAKRADDRAQQIVDRQNAHRELANRINGTVLNFTAPMGKDGRMFGSVSSKMIEQELRKMQINIEKRMIMAKNITTFGTTNVTIELEKGIEAVIQVIIKERA